MDTPSPSHSEAGLPRASRDARKDQRKRPTDKARAAHIRWAGMADTRQELLNAAARLLRKKGLASTREIAREAGCADGALYTHFKDRVSLYLALLSERLPDFATPLQSLPYRVGEGTVAGNLEEVGHAALAFQYQVTPLFGALFAEPDLLAAYQQALRKDSRGPHRSAGAMAAYPRAEQRLGRIAASIDPAVAAEVLFGACLYRAFSRNFMGMAPAADEDRDFVRSTVHTLLRGLEPSPPAP
jgi:AcrR family transcriptional regulator